MAGFGSNNKAELLALRASIHQATKLNLQRLIIEGDSYCVIQWARQSSNPPWNLIYIIEEVVHLSRELNVSFHHVANYEADKLTKEGVLKTALTVFNVIACVLFLGRSLQVLVLGCARLFGVPFRLLLLSPL